MLLHLTALLDHTAFILHPRSGSDEDLTNIHVALYLLHDFEISPSPLAKLSSKSGKILVLLTQPLFQPGPLTELSTAQG